MSVISTRQIRTVRAVIRFNPSSLLGRSTSSELFARERARIVEAQRLRARHCTKHIERQRSICLFCFCRTPGSYRFPSSMCFWYFRAHTKAAYAPVGTEDPLQSGSSSPSARRTHTYALGVFGFAGLGGSVFNERTHTTSNARGVVSQRLCTLRAETDDGYVIQYGRNVASVVAHPGWLTDVSFHCEEDKTDFDRAREPARSSSTGERVLKDTTITLGTPGALMHRLKLFSNSMSTNVFLMEINLKFFFLLSYAND